MIRIFQMGTVMIQDGGIISLSFTRRGPLMLARKDAWERPMKRQWLAGAIFLLLFLLPISGCVQHPVDAQLDRILSGTAHSSGWVGIDVAWRMQGLRASHTIVSVAAGSPASRAGIRVGDEIVLVGAENAGSLNVFEVAKRMRESPAPFKVSVTRAGHQGLLTFVLSKPDERPAPQQPQQGPPMAVGSTESRAPSNEIAPTTDAAGVPPYATAWGFRGKYRQGDGVVLTQIEPQSAAEEAGLKTGDVIVAVNRAALKGASDLDRPPYVPVRLLVRRDGAQIERTILPGGIVRLRVSEIERRLPIPGVPAPEKPAALSAIEALEIINVLDRVVLDPRTGQIAVIGHYDRAYNTGRIPYLDLLKTAMANPAPILNLTESPETKTSSLNQTEKVRTNLTRMVDAVRGHPEFERERQLLIRELAKAYGLTPQEYVDWYNYVKLDDKKTLFPPQGIRDIQRKVFANLGYLEVSQALALSFAQTPEAAVKALQVLGRGDEAKAILARPSQSDALLGELLAALYLAIPQAAEIVSIEGLETLREWYRTKKVTWEVVVRNVQNLLMPYSPKGENNANRSNLMVGAFTRIFLSTRAVQILEGLPTPYVAIETIDLDRRSQLARIMYGADYALKSLTVMPELFQHIPGSLSRMEYQNRHGMLIAGSNLYYHQWLEPKRVDMQVSPDRRVIQFNASQMRYLFADYSHYWEKPPNEKLEQAFAAWCNQFMDHYDAYAQVVPAFHELREAAKVLALAKLLIAEGITPDLRGIVQEKWQPPDKVPANWVLAQGIYQGNSMGTVRAFEGGVSFKTRGSWTQVIPSTSTTTEATAQLGLSAQLGQQATQAATAGDLEQARHLAELSAQAMTGSVSRADLARLKVVVPESRPAPVNAAAVQLQKALLKETRQQLDALRQGPAGKEAAGASLARMNRLYDQMRDDPLAASDVLRQLQQGRQAVPPGGNAPTGAIAVAGSAAQLEQLEYEKRYDQWVRQERQLIEARLQAPDPYIQGLEQSLRTKAPPALPPRGYDRLQPGDVLLFTHQGITDLSFWINLGDRVTTDVRSPVSHTVLFLKEVNGKKLFLDHTTERGSHIIDEEEFLRTYGGRDGLVASSRLAVAQPVREAEAARIWEAAKELIKQEAAIQKSKTDRVVDQSGYGLYGNDNMVCSEISRFVLIKAGRDIPETLSPLKRLLGIHYGPANFFSDDYHFVITPLWAGPGN